jgi:hypothetical protein
MIKAIIWDIGGVLAKMENLAPHRPSSLTIG